MSAKDANNMPRFEQVYLILIDHPEHQLRLDLFENIVHGVCITCKNEKVYPQVSFTKPIGTL